MRKSTLTAAVALLMSAAAPLAYAQTMAPPAAAPAATHPMTPDTASETRPAHATNAALSLESGQMRASKMIGSTVYDVQNRNIGSVKDVILDRDGKVAAVVLDVGSFLGVGGKFVAVNLGDIKTDNDRLTLDRSKEQLESAQAYLLDTDRGGTSTH